MTDTQIMALPDPVDNADAKSERERSEWIAAYLSIANESLLGTDVTGWDAYLRRVEPNNVRLALADDQVVGGMAFYRCGQFFGGRSVPMAGFSGVAIAGSHRGTGVCRKLLEQTLRELRQEGIPLACLYASTQRLYRSVGFEQAGSRWEYELPLRCLPEPDRSLPCHRHATPDLHVLERLENTRGEFANGCLHRSQGLWERLLHPHSEQPGVAYLLGEPEQPEGYVILYQGNSTGRVPAVLRCGDWVATTPAALRRLMALTWDHRSMHDRFRWPGGTDDPLLLFASEAWADVVDMERWLLRLVDVPAALSARGYQQDVDEQIQLHVQDPLFPQNSGPWHLSVTGGRAVVKQATHSDSGLHLQMSVQALAPLYSGLFSARELSYLGWLSGTANAVATADRLFAGPRPWMAECF
ncbi:MAG: GNAT family N-acetyltransferase [Planctomycetota bacterium]